MKKENNEEVKTEVKARGMWKGLLIYGLVKLLFGAIMIGLLICLLKFGGLSAISEFLAPGTGERIERPLHPTGNEWWHDAFEDIDNYDPLAVGPDGVTVGDETYSYDEWDQDLDSMLKGKSQP